jgi:hypothetical protein
VREVEKRNIRKSKESSLQDIERGAKARPAETDPARKTAAAVQHGHAGGIHIHSFIICTLLRAVFGALDNAISG